MEKNPQPQKNTYTDVFANLDRDEYKKQIVMVELGLPEPTDENDRALESEPLEDLDEELGYGDEDEAVIYTGLAFKLNKHGEPILDNPQMFVEKELTFGGTGYYDIDEKWRILFEFRDTSSKKMQSYAAPFDGMVQLSIIENPSEKYDVNGTLNQHAELSKILISDPGFYTAPQAQQMELLKSVAVHCHDLLLKTVDPENVSVETPLFYVHADNAEEKQFTVTCVDQTPDHFEERTAVTGDMIGVIYLEVCLDPGRPFASANEFFVGGAPCMVVRNETQATTSYIPIDKIESVEKNS